MLKLLQGSDVFDGVDKNSSVYKAARCAYRGSVEDIFILEMNSCSDRREYTEVTVDEVNKFSGNVTAAVRGLFVQHQQELRSQEAKN